ncbi:MAG: ATP-binding cassette domain-containing protein [Anaerolineae bacterium]
MALAQVSDLVKRYSPDGPNAVDGLSFEIGKGELFSLLGPNGAGKTTAISVISTLLPPTSGEVVVNGYSVRQNPMAVRGSIGVVPQDLALYDDLTGRENLRFWGEMRGLRGAALRGEIEEKLRLTDLTDRAGSRVRTYSGGMKRRLNLAVGLLGNPPLLLLDEPTVAIDPQSRRYILDWVKDLNRQGVTVLYTTHNMEEAQELSHRIGIIDYGRLIALGTLQELIERVGERETLVLGLTDQEGGADLAAALSGVEGVFHADADDGQVVLGVRAAQEALPAVLNIASGLGLSVRTIEIHEPNLEAVFLHLTGRALRD